MHQFSDFGLSDVTAGAGVREAKAVYDAVGSDSPLLAGFGAELAAHMRAGDQDNAQRLAYAFDWYCRIVVSQPPG